MIKDAEKFSEILVDILTRPNTLKKLQKALDAATEKSLEMSEEYKIITDYISFSETKSEQSMLMTAGEILKELNSLDLSVYKIGRILSASPQVKSTVRNGRKRYYINSISPINGAFKAIDKPKKKKKKKKKKISKVQQDIERKMKERALNQS